MFYLFPRWYRIGSWYLPMCKFRYQNWYWEEKNSTETSLTLTRVNNVVFWEEILSCILMHTLLMTIRKLQNVIILKALSHHVLKWKICGRIHLCLMNRPRQRLCTQRWRKSMRNFKLSSSLTFKVCVDLRELRATVSKTEETELYPRVLFNLLCQTHFTP